MITRKELRRARLIAVRSDETTRSLLGSGMDMDSVRSVLDGMTQGQSVMLATNEIMNGPEAGRR